MYFLQKAIHKNAVVVQPYSCICMESIKLNGWWKGHILVSKQTKMLANEPQIAVVHHSCDAHVRFCVTIFPIDFELFVVFLQVILQSCFEQSYCMVLIANYKDSRAVFQWKAKGNLNGLVLQINCEGRITGATHIFSELLKQTKISLWLKLIRVYSIIYFRYYRKCTPQMAGELNLKFQII